MVAKNTQIDGDVSVGRNVAVGGRATVQGNAVFKRRVTVEGWLDAPNIKGPCKGLFASAEALAKAYPCPMPGWWALVGDTLPADVYRVEGGVWVATGEQGGETSLDLTRLDEDVSELREKVISLEENDTQQDEDIATLQKYWSYIGIATTATDPGTPSARVYYFAIEPGTYANFTDADTNAPVVIENYGIHMLVYDLNGSGAWSVRSLLNIAQASGSSQSMVMSQAAVKTYVNSLIGDGTVDLSEIWSAVNTLKQYWSYIGIATTATDPGTPSTRVYYFAVEPGTYANFTDADTNAPIVIENYGIHMLVYDLNGSGAWSVRSLLNIAQETGDSQSVVMSQAAVTAHLGSGSVDLTEVWTAIAELQNELWPITISLTASSTLLEYTGADQTVRLTVAVTQKGEALSGSLGYWFKGASFASGELLYSGAAANAQIDVTVNLNGTTTFGFLWASGDSLEESPEATIGIRQVCPMYFGFNALTTPTEAMLTSLTGGMTKQSIKTSAAGTYTLTNPADGNYPWFCVPLGFTISKVTLNGFDVPLEEAQAFVVTGLGSYIGYRGSNALVAGTYTFVIS